MHGLGVLMWYTEARCYQIVWFTSLHGVGYSILGLLAMRALDLSWDVIALTRCNNSYRPPRTHGVPCKRGRTTCPITGPCNPVCTDYYIYRESGMYGSKSR